MTRKPFNPESAFDATAEAARQRIVDFCTNEILQKARTPEQVEALICGYLTGLVGALLCTVAPKDREKVEKYIANYIPLAVEQAYAIMDGAQ